jgi:hypothetical protein
MTEGEENNQPQILDQLGPYKKHPPVEIGCLLSQAAYKRYHKLTGTVARPAGVLHEQTPPRMMYIAEAISTGLRLNATWALSFPAMSLARDRYEQVVRFSWLIRMNDPWMWKQYAATYYTKWRKLYAAMNPTQRTEFDNLSPPPPGWMTETPTKEQRKVMERYQSMSLADMVEERDTLPPVGTSTVDKVTLSDLYGSVYAHYSSVSHYDFYAVRLLNIFQNTSGEYVLAADPFWPAMLVLQNCLFDIVQCREATAKLCEADDIAAFEDMYSIWDDTMHRQGLSKEDFEKAKQARSAENSSNEG